MNFGKPLAANLLHCPKGCGLTVAIIATHNKNKG
jgi:hypothetical protein